MNRLVKLDLVAVNYYFRPGASSHFFYLGDILFYQWPYCCVDRIDTDYAKLCRRVYIGFYGVDAFRIFKKDVVGFLVIRQQVGKNENRQANRKPADIYQGKEFVFFSNSLKRSKYNS